MDLKGKVALITGAARGLGRCFGESLLQRGAKVCLTDVNVEEGNNTAAELQPHFGEANVFFCECDVTKDEDFEYAWDTCEQLYGPIDILINNAGLGNERNWKLTYDINIGGTTRGTLFALKRMGLNNDGRGGTVVNIASIAGLKTIPFGPIYGASKHAIVGLSRDLGHPFHFAHTGVRVQCLCPGLVKTQFLADSLQNSFSTEVATALKAFAGKIVPMEPEVVSAALVQLIEEQKHGAVLVVEGTTEPYYVDAPVPS